MLRLVLNRLKYQLLWPNEDALHIVQTCRALFFFELPLPLIFGALLSCPLFGLLFSAHTRTRMHSLALFWNACSFDGNFKMRAHICPYFEKHLSTRESGKEMAGGKRNIKIAPKFEEGSGKKMVGTELLRFFYSNMLLHNRSVHK